MVCARGRSRGRAWPCEGVRPSARRLEDRCSCMDWERRTPRGATPRPIAWKRFSVRLVRQARPALARDRADGAAARQRHRGAPARASTRWTRCSRSTPTRCDAALPRARAGARRPTPRATRSRPAGIERRRDRRRRRQHLHRLSLPGPLGLRRRAARPAAPTCRPTTWSARAAPRRCRTCSSAEPLLASRRLRARALGLRRGEQRRDVPRRRSRRADQRLPVRRRRRRRGAVARRRR